MVDQKRVLEHCVNFDEIVNCDFLEDDVLTKKLIEYYQDFVFNIDDNNDEQLSLIKKLDEAMYKYIADYRFAKRLKKELRIDEVTKEGFAYLDQLMRFIIQFMGEYEKEVVRNIVPTKWI
jgi:hypothetical protein